MQVAKISAEKAQSLVGVYYTPSMIFNPVQDGNGDWIISLQEAETLDPSEYEIIEWVPPIYPDDEE